MTDRHAGYIVTLEKDIREDDAEALITALGALRGVIAVKPVVSDSRIHIVEQRVRMDLSHKLWDVLHPKD